MLFFLTIACSLASLDTTDDPLEGDKSHQFPFTKILELSNNARPSLGLIYVTSEKTEDVNPEAIKTALDSSCDYIAPTTQYSCRIFSDQLLPGAIFVTTTSNYELAQILKEFPPVDYVYIDVPKEAQMSIDLSEFSSTTNVIIGSYLSTTQSSRGLTGAKKGERLATQANLLLSGNTEKVPFLILVDQDVKFTSSCTCDNLYLVHTYIHNSGSSPANLENKVVIGSNAQIGYLLEAVSQGQLILSNVQLSFIFNERVPDLTLTYTKEAICISYEGMEEAKILGIHSNEDETSGDQTGSPCPENTMPLLYNQAKSFGLLYNFDATVAIKFAKGTDVDSTTQFPSLNLTLGNIVFGENIYHNWLSPSSIDTTTSGTLTVTFQEEGWDSTGNHPLITYSVSPGVEVNTDEIQQLNIQLQNRYTPTYTMPLSIPYQFNLDFNYHETIKVSFIYQKNGQEEFDGREIYTRTESGIFVVNNDNEKIFVELGVRNRLCWEMVSVRFEINKESPNLEVNENQLPDTCMKDESLFYNVLSHFNEEEKKEILNGQLPSIGFLMIYPDVTPDDVDRFYKLLNKTCLGQEGDNRALCQKLISSVKESHFVNGTNLNNVLKAVSSDLDVLYLDGDLAFPEKIDLSNLPSPMTVVIGDPVEGNSNSYSVLNLYSRFLSHIKKKVQNRKSIKSVSSQAIVSLVGGINSKVPFLIIRDWRVKFVDSDSNSDNLLLQRTMIVKGSTKLANNHLIVDMNQMRSLYNRMSNEYIELSVKQPTIYSSQQIGDFIIEELTIEYQDSQWQITTGPTDITNGQSFLPYSVAKEKLGFILNLRRSLTININCQNQALDEYLPINLTVGRTVMGDTYVDSFMEFWRAGPSDDDEEDPKTLNNGAKLLASEVIKVTVKADGWGNKKPKSINIIYSKGVTVNTAEIQNKGITVNTNEQEIIPPKSPDDKPGDDDKGGNGDGGGNGLPTGAIIGIVIAVVVVVGVVVGVLVYFFVFRKKSDSKSENQAEAL